MRWGDEGPTGGRPYASDAATRRASSWLAGSEPQRESVTHSRCLGLRTLAGKRDAQKKAPIPHGNEDQGNTHGASFPAEGPRPGRGRLTRPGRSPGLGIILLVAPSHPPKRGSGSCDFRPPTQLRGSAGLVTCFPFTHRAADPNEFLLCFCLDYILGGGGRSQEGMTRHGTVPT